MHGAAPVGGVFGLKRQEDETRRQGEEGECRMQVSTPRAPFRLRRVVDLNRQGATVLWGVAYDDVVQELSADFSYSRRSWSERRASMEGKRTQATPFSQYRRVQLSSTAQWSSAHQRRSPVRHTKDAVPLEMHSMPWCHHAMVQWGAHVVPCGSQHKAEMQQPRTCHSRRLREDFLSHIHIHKDSCSCHASLPDVDE